MLANKSPATETTHLADSSRTEAGPILQIDKEEDSKANPLADRMEILLLLQTGSPEGTSTLLKGTEKEVIKQDKLTLI
jgi:hypothetical protein